MEYAGARSFFVPALCAPVRLPWEQRQSILPGNACAQQFSIFGNQFFNRQISKVKD
jgi:hypothetical protein